MPKPQDKFKELADLYKVVKNSLTRDEFVSAFKQMADVLAKGLVDVNKKIDARLSQIRNGRDGRDGKDGKSVKGPKGDKGDKGDRGDTGIAMFGGRGKDGKDGSPDTSEEIVIKLESLEGEDRLDASAIKNLPEAVNKHYGSTGIHGPLWALQDVSISGITAGQSLQWDGDKWVAYTPAGGGGTPVWAEDLTPQGPGTSYTLAFTPIAGSVRLFRGGAYQSVANGDYSIAGANITLGTTTQTSEVLVVDYSH